MEVGVAILLFVCMTALLYVLLSLKITKQVDLQIKEFYKTRIHQDIQEFYREMESYASLFENRIQRFRTLVDRGDEILRQMEKTPEATHTRSTKKIAVEEKKTKHTHPKTAQKATQQKNLDTKIAVSSKVAKAAKLKKTEKVNPPHKEKPSYTQLDVRRRETLFTDEHDVTIAEELIKDMVLQDEIVEKKKTKPEKSVKEEKLVKLQEEPTNFFARIGKRARPYLMPDKKSEIKNTELIPEKKSLQVEKNSPYPIERKTESASEFREVLRLAEEIKAKKKEERKQAEIDAKATFYANGDTYNIRNQTLQNLSPISNKDTPKANTAAMPQKNNLVVKELDSHTINFLIDSLVNDNGYRRQALRALTENNVPLDEIARLSKIDIGELELMRQFGASKNAY
ncbi:MAG: hypothetical protein LDLANPLL_01037 [Turneriella sp.]|nr:hypothetical protein [Turneriella sp.]